MSGTIKQKIIPGVYSPTTIVEDIPRLREDLESITPKLTKVEILTRLTKILTIFDDFQALAEKEKARTKLLKEKNIALENKISNQKYRINHLIEDKQHAESETAKQRAENYSLKRMIRNIPEQISVANEAAYLAGVSFEKNKNG